MSNVNSDTASSSSSPASSSSSLSSNRIPYPRSGVAVAVRCAIRTKNGDDDVASDNNSNVSSPITTTTPYYLLVRRGNPPHAGQWSFPGGKLELGETALEGAQRELSEETQFDFTTTTNNDDNENDRTIAWFSQGAFATADSIVWSKEEDDHEEDSNERKLEAHYLLAICFAEVKSIQGNVDDDNDVQNCHHLTLPNVEAADDAQDAQWFSCHDIQEMHLAGTTTPQIADLVKRAELLYKHGVLLPTISI